MRPYTRYTGVDNDRIKNVLGTLKVNGSFLSNLVEGGHSFIIIKRGFMKKVCEFLV